MSSFLAELKRRKVIRAGVIYGAVCFAVLEGAEIILSTLGIPGSIMRFLVMLAILAFPVVVALSWYYELTPDGLRRSGDTGIEPAAHWLSPAAGILTTLFLVLGAAAWWLSSSLEGAADAPVVPEPVSAASVAVLPFANLSGDPENEYFSDGLSEELLNVLARVPGLKVAARTSSFSFKGKDEDVREIGRSLGVANILEGSVRSSAERVRVGVQLVQAEDGFQLWSDSYDRDIDDIFAVQDEIASAVVVALEVALVGGVDDPVLEPVTTNQMAYDKYLWGRYNLGKATEEGIYEAIENFNGSIMLDSAYARSYSGLADAHVVLPLYSEEVAAAPVEHLAQSLANAREAVRLDADLAEAHTSLGGALFNSWNLEGAVTAFERSIALNPQYPLAHQWLAGTLVLLGRHGEALAAGRTAVALDPLSPSASVQLGRVLRWIDRPDEAIEHLERARALEPGSAIAWEELAFAYVQSGAWAEARDAVSRWASAAGRDPDPLLRLVDAAASRAEGGPPGDASEVTREETSPVRRARWYVLAGQSELAAREIQRAYDERDYNLHRLHDPLFGELRSDPRVQAVARELGIRWSASVAP